MPTYEYACRTCGEHLEVVQSFKDEPLEVCPSCGGPLRKVFGNVGVVFKGSGFYKTDNRSSKGAKVSSSDLGGDSSSPSTSKSEKDKSSTPADSSASSSSSDKSTKPDKSEKKATAAAS
jgi:putative FmdB family regulatory protein